MALRRKNREVYVPLSPPSRSMMQIPDMAVVARDKDMTNAMLRVVLENVDKCFRGDAHLPTWGSDVERALVVALAGDENSDEPRARLARLACVLGIVVAEMENHSGVARAGQSEVHYRNALLIAQSQIGADVTAEFIEDYDFAVYSAYYLGRCGEPEIRRVLAATLGSDDH